jgi:hypothetical protein
VRNHRVEHALSQSSAHLGFGVARVIVGTLEQAIERLLRVDLLSERRGISHWERDRSVAVVLHRPAPGDVTGVVGTKRVGGPGIVRPELKRRDRRAVADGIRDGLIDRHVGALLIRSRFASRKQRSATNGVVAELPAALLVFEPAHEGQLCLQIFHRGQHRRQLPSRAATGSHRKVFGHVMPVREHVSDEALGCRTLARGTCAARVEERRQHR